MTVPHPETATATLFLEELRKVVSLPKDATAATFDDALDLAMAAFVAPHNREVDQARAVERALIRAFTPAKAGDREGTLRAFTEAADLAR